MVPSDTTSNATPARAALYKPLITSSYNPLLVHVRLPREKAASNDAESSLHGQKQIHPATNNSRRRPRADSSDDEVMKARGDGMTSDSSSSVTNRREDMRPRKARKPTYVVQKEEKETLLQELRLLEARAEELRAHVGMPSLKTHETTQQRDEENRTMERARREQLLSMCSVQSVFSAYMREQFSNPLKVPLHLGRDMTQRRATLMRLRREKLDLACRFMDYRLHGMDDRLPLDDSMTWTSADGDFCFSRTDVSHFAGVRGVKQVFDALHYYITNMEITISEVLGQLTLREDIDCVDTRATNQRIVSSTDHGIVVESNSVSFFEYYEHSHDRNGEEFAVFTTDSVDDDELYPYCPQERVRKNVTAAITLSVQRNPHSITANDATTAGNDVVVVMCRSAYFTLKRPQFPISAAASEDLRETVSAWGRVMTSTVRDHVYAQTNPAPFLPK